MSGYIKLHRQFFDWGWRTKPNHVTVFIDLLCLAQWKPSEFAGVRLSPGDALVSLEKLALRTGLTVCKVRIVLRDLLSTGEISQKKAGKMRVISIANWEKYQDGDTINSNVIASKQQRNSIVIAPLEEGKERKKEKKNTSPDVLEWVAAFNSYASTKFTATPDVVRQVKKNMSLGITLEDARATIKHFGDEWTGSEKMKEHWNPKALFNRNFPSRVEQVKNAEAVRLQAQYNKLAKEFELE